MLNTEQFFTTCKTNIEQLLASNPAAPESVSIDGAVSSDTVVRWSPVKDAAAYRVHWRRADRNDWSDSRVVPSDAANELILPAIIVVDNFFGVSAISADGLESLVTFGGLPPAK